MIFFGHLGLTAGAFKLYERAAAKKKETEPPEIDYRLALVGAILPDLIDKPIGALLFINTYHNSRIYAHTLLFSVILLIIGGILFKRRGSSAFLVLGAASAIHLLLDRPWVYLETLLWPFLNIGPALAAGSNRLSVLLGFPYKFENWISQDITSLMRDPLPLIFETVGLVILGFFFIRLLRRKKLTAFIKTGRL